MPIDNLIKVTEEELRTDRLYYLSHPLTSFGNIAWHKDDAMNIEVWLVKHQHIFCINPILLPLGKSDEKAMRKCRILYQACDAIILCSGWEKSKGCKEEFKWAAIDHKPIYLYREGELYKYGANKSS